MGLSRDQVIEGTVSELKAFADLISRLTSEAWETSTRCAGWKVADVAGHVAGFISMIAAGRFADLAAPDVIDRQVAERRDMTPDRVADELRLSTDSLAEQLASLDDDAWQTPAPAPVDGTIGFGIEHIWYDTYVHADDIRDALGEPSQRGDGLRAAVGHLAEILGRNSWAPQSLELEGFEPISVGGDGPVVHADPLAFMLVATGRAHPIEIGYNGELNIYAQ